MRWRRRPRPGAARRAAGLEELDPDTLEVIELDDTGLPGGPAASGPHDPLPEVAYSRTDDPASLAGIWEALARS